jgi:predicted LPLAT superfamily acyltransferase
VQATVDAREEFRNIGPACGFIVLSRAQQLLSPWLLQVILIIGTWVAIMCLPTQRRCSREFLSLVYGERARLIDVWRHFFTYINFQLLRLRLGSGAKPIGSLEGENGASFEALMESGEPALFGTFHFGHSDLLGFLLATRGRRVAMVRLRVGNSDDIKILERHFGRGVSFIWVNEPENLLFAIKSAIERGDSIALQCDRLFSSRSESFYFLGAKRMFPFAIYHLAILFGRPVMFCLGLPDGNGGTSIIPSPLFRPDPALRREENLVRARIHFQEVLRRLETTVRKQPMQWFNFLALNPEVHGANSGAVLHAESI